MTSVRFLPAYEVVRRAYPRPEPQERELVAIAVGRAIDGALSQFGYELRAGRRPTMTSLMARAASLLDEALEEAAVAILPGEREKILGQVRGVIRAYRGSVLVGLPRPKTRVILIENRVGIYAQPDYWDGKQRIFEMKSYRALPPPPDVALQLRLFQLAFPGFETVLVCLNRHAEPVEVTAGTIPPPTAEEAETLLRLAHDLAQQFGQEKVLEYVEGPFVPYRLPPTRPTSEASGPAQQP